jgi:hypothetical protein
MPVLKSRTWARYFHRIFPTQSAVDVQIARLAVLYEDLKIEAICAAAEAGTVKLAEELGEGYRRFYFLRRSLATLEEFDGAFHQLNMNRDFRNAQRLWTADHRKQWAAMIRFFTHNRPLLKNVRNAIGGHFSDHAARHSLSEVCKDNVAMIEIVVHPSGGGAGIKLFLATDLVVNALTKERGSKPELEFVDELFQFSIDAFGQAVQAVHLIAVNHLIKQFE